MDSLEGRTSLLHAAWTYSSRIAQSPKHGVKKTNLLTSILLRDDLLFILRCKKTALKWSLISLDTMEPSSDGHETMLPGPVKIQQLVTYKYLHKVRSAVLASASKHKIPKTRKPRQTWKRLFSQPTRKVRMLCNLLLRRKLCTTAGFLRSETCIHAINSPTQPQENIMKSSKLKYRLSKHNLLTKHR